MPRKPFTVNHVPELDFIPDFDREGTSTSACGVLTNKIFKYMGEDEGRLLYDRLLESYRIDELVTERRPKNRLSTNGNPSYVGKYDRFDTSDAEPQKPVRVSITEMRRAVLARIDTKKVASIPNMSGGISIEAKRHAVSYPIADALYERHGAQAEYHQIYAGVIGWLEGLPAANVGSLFNKYFTRDGKPRPLDTAA